MDNLKYLFQSFGSKNESQLLFFQKYLPGKGKLLDFSKFWEENRQVLVFPQNYLHGKGKVTKLGFPKN